MTPPAELEEEEGIRMQDGKVYWYVLFVRTGAEERLVKRIGDNPDSDISRPFVLRKTCVFRRQGQKSLFQKICFPGYIFIESSLSAFEFKAQIFPIVYKLREVYRFLNYGDKSYIAMREEERIVLSHVFGKEHCVDFSIGFKVGDSVKIISGALEGNENKILRINKNRNEAIIEVTIFGTMVPVSVGIEVIEKKTEK